MALAVNLVRRVLSAKFIYCCWSNPWCDFRVTHTPKCNEPAKKRANHELWLNNTDCLSVFPVPHTKYDTAKIWHCLANQNGRYFYKTHLATLCVFYDNNKVHRANEALQQLGFAFLSYLEQGTRSWSVFCNCGRSFGGNHCLRIEEFFFLW